MNGRIAGDVKYARVSKFGQDYFTLSHSATYLVLTGFVLVGFLGVAWMLKRRSRA
jgi:hypothetical protein